MKTDYFEYSKKKLLDMYDIDVFKDVLFGRKGRVFLYADISLKESIQLEVISNHLTVLGLHEASSIPLDELLSYIDTNNKYAEVSGKSEYLHYVKSEMTSFHREVNISFPIKVNNNRHWIHFSGFPVEKNAKIYVFLAHDISDLMNQEEQIFEKTHRDSLTGLFNKYTFDFHYGKRYQLKNLHVLYLDLDNFKIINDQYGHKLGNDVLQSFANLLKTKQKKYNLFYRLGGDEFVGLFFANKKEITKIVEEILNETRNIKLTDDKLPLTVSIGVIQATKREDLARKADDLLYLAKNRGKDQFVYEVEQ